MRGKMEFKRILQWLLLTLMPIYLVTGCGDLEPEMQDTRTVILNMDFDQRSSSRTSSVSAAELSQYNTHLILALPSWENLTSSYKNFYSSFAQGLMNTADKKVSLEIPLNTQMKIFAFLFKENYSMSELFSGVREVGYYGKSQSFSIGTQTNNLSLGITLIQVPGTGTDTGGGTDNTAPTASVTAATITTSGNAVVQSTETGTAYLVNTTVSVSNNLTSITGAADSQWNSVAISLANTDTNLPATGLADGTYKVYAVDAAGNLSSASSNSVTVATTVTDTTAPTVSFSPANGATGVAISDNITITFSEAVRNIDNTVLTDSNSGDANGVGSLITLRLNNTYGTNIAFYATIDTNKTVITIDPTNNLPHSQAVYVVIGATVEDSAGNPITAANATFTTVQETTGPTVSSVYPADNQNGVSISDNISVTFSEAMDSTYVTTSTSDTNCAGNIWVSSDNFSSCVRMSSEPASSNSNMTFTLDPHDNLTVGTTYKTRVTTGVKDTAGNSMSSQYETSSGFTPADLIAPTVTSVSTTSDNQSSVSVSDNISLTFSEIMDNSSINTNTDNTSCYGSFQVSSDNFSTCVQMSSSPSISNSAKTFTFDPSDNLSYDNKYKIKLTTDTKDENGVSLESPYETSFNTFDNSLVAYYPFNGNAKDLTSNGRDFTVYDNTTLTNGKDNSSNSAYSFDGNGDYLEYTANIPSFDNYTISLWAKPDSSGTYKAMFSSYNNSGTGFQIDLESTRFHIRKASSSGGNILLSTAELGDWTFIAFTYDGTNSIGYIDNETPVIDPGGTTEFNRFRIGRNRNGNTYFTGAIDELRIYNRALTAPEISSLFAIFSN